MTCRRIAAGELDQRVDYTRGDLGIIAAEINRMAVQLRDLRDTESGHKELAAPTLRRRDSVHLRTGHCHRRKKARSSSSTGQPTTFSETPPAIVWR